ncbi:putative pilus assembly protein FilE [Acinetobacter thermotolerans]|uniref:putative pilus assembly protein FilE n=1 Tax=Acinetobacter thermotolerans TaxID=3151487 RepID=UPI00325AE572
MIRKGVWLKTVLVLGLVPISVSVSAKEFVTIIGPDGRPMVVPPPTGTKDKKAKAVVSQQSTVNQQESHQALSVPKVQPKTSAILGDTAAQKINTVVQPVQPVQPVITQKSTAEVQEQQSQPRSGISQVDGVEYVDSEYLEAKEFNLEGKKRFYTMPEGIVDKNLGSVRFQNVEREKGVGQSTLKALFQKSTQQDVPIILAQTYYRVSGDETIESLGQRCFSGKKLKKSKKLALKKEVSLWPRAPITKDEFDYEVVAVDAGIKNIQLKSFASSQNKPVFYWPFTVFLDHKGCVLEGAGGFKNQDGQGNYFQYESIEGILQIPEQTAYVLLTPLASAIDVEDKMLSNQGQLKLTAIR